MTGSKGPVFLFGHHMHWSIGILVYAIGAGMALLAWWRFRKPGVDSDAVVPLWQVHRSLKPAGAALTAVGGLVCLVGLILYYAAEWL